MHKAPSTPRCAYLRIERVLELSGPFRSARRPAYVLVVQSISAQYERAWYNPAMASAVPASYAVSGTHPETRRFHGESCNTLKEALAKADELRQSGYENVTITPSTTSP